ATRFIDYTRIKELAEKAKEYRLIPEYVEEFFKRAFSKAGGKIKELKNGLIAIESIPYEIRDIAQREDFKNRYGILSKQYPKATFDKEVAFGNPMVEFISFGHPLFEALLEWTLKKFKESAERGAFFKDPSGRLNGYLWFYVGEIKDGKGEIAGKRIFAIYQPEDMQPEENRFKEVNPAILWDLSPVHNAHDLKPKLDLLDEKVILPFVIKCLEKYRAEILKERQRQAEVKKKYGLNSLNHLIDKLDTEILELIERQREGEKVDLVIKNKEMQKESYLRAKDELEKEIEQELSLIFPKPELLTVVRVISEKDEMIEDEKIERLGMEIAMEYERLQGREPEDLSKENLGFDIRSRGKEEVRYIEVKARAGEGEIALT
ncbi:MAG: helicase, partial [Thermodesulfobacterium geofontis]